MPMKCPCLGQAWAEIPNKIVQTFSLKLECDRTATDLLWFQIVKPTDLESNAFVLPSRVSELPSPDLF